MSRLHYFYPENDLALALDIARYTAPPAAVKLRRSGVTLPLWYGGKGDSVLTDGVNAGWLSLLRDRFDIPVAVYNHRPDGLTPAPWGWSKAARQVFIDIGFDSKALPSDEKLSRLRNLSHRRTAAEASKLLARRVPFAIAPAATEVRSLAELKQYVEAVGGDVMVKLPWSSSGRGLAVTNRAMLSSQGTMLEGMIRRQGSLMAEPRHRGRADFAMLLTMDHGRCRFDGYSLFGTTRLGSYEGNTLAPQAVLAQDIAALTDSTQLSTVQTVLPSIIEEVAADYTGPLGVDMMAVDSPDYCLDAVVEINFRMTMGHVCRIFYENYVEDGAKGTFTVGHGQASGLIDADTRSGRMRGGTLDLAQPGSDFSFIVSLGS